MPTPTSRQSSSTTAPAVPLPTAPFDHPRLCLGPFPILSMKHCISPPRPTVDHPRPCLGSTPHFQHVTCCFIPHLISNSSVRPGHLMANDGPALHLPFRPQPHHCTL